jgi:hypothetical protein
MTYLQKADLYAALAVGVLPLAFGVLVVWLSSVCDGDTRPHPPCPRTGQPLDALVRAQLASDPGGMPS